MKRCPRCHRVEAGDSLAFCRADGTPLVVDYSALRGEAGAARHDATTASSEIETSILPHQTDGGRGRSTGPTTALPAQPSGTTRELPKPKRRRALIVGVAFVVAALVVSGYFYLAGKKGAAINSVAVMPFQNESGSAETEYLSDGMTETLISSLSQIPNLKVKARASVFRYKGKEIDPKRVAAELNVGAILNGRVVQRGEQLILSLELVDAQTENVIWSEIYNRKQSDLISLQSEIARDVSGKLKVKLSGADQQKLARNYTANTEAYKLYLQGRFYWNRRNPQDIQKAVGYFNQAIALDPNYTLGYTGLADAYSSLSNYRGAPPHETMPKAKDAALKALSQDNTLAEAHASLAFIFHFYEYDFAGAEREYLRAAELNPNFAQAHHLYGILLSNLGRNEESLARLRHALEIDPLSLIINRTYGERLLLARRYDDAVAQLKKAVELDAGFLSARYSLAVAYQLKGSHAEAVEEFAKYQEQMGDPQTATLMRESYAKGGWRGFLRMVADKRLRFNSPWDSPAAVHAALGEKDKAFAELNRSYESRENIMTLIKVDPRLDPLRGDPRFEELLKKVGFP